MDQEESQEGDQLYISTADQFGGSKVDQEGGTVNRRSVTESLFDHIEATLNQLFNCLKLIICLQNDKTIGARMLKEKKDKKAIIMLHQFVTNSVF